MNVRYRVELSHRTQGDRLGSYVCRMEWTVIRTSWTASSISANRLRYPIAIDRMYGSISVSRIR